eukprot:TRINITY_DN1219_c1_g1_i2.p1 TRINITY_DN1219_c1_g1~~TRINITY_DN1219_c1_g1_i2.p1  ORF type:complete len:866 (+),score=262.32 TRINITY_DN1219_c1_g1_i2:74-2599(+)
MAAGAAGGSSTLPEPASGLRFTPRRRPAALGESPEGRRINPASQSLRELRQIFQLEQAGHGAQQGAQQRAAGSRQVQVQYAQQQQQQPVANRLADHREQQRLLGEVLQDLLCAMRTSGGGVQQPVVRTSSPQPQYRHTSLFTAAKAGGQSVSPPPQDPVDGPQPASDTERHLRELCSQLASRVQALEAGGRSRSAEALSPPLEDDGFPRLDSAATRTTIVEATPRGTVRREVIRADSASHPRSPTPPPPPPPPAAVTVYSEQYTSEVLRRVGDLERRLAEGATQRRHDEADTGLWQRVAELERRAADAERQQHDDAQRLALRAAAAERRAADDLERIAAQLQLLDAQRREDCARLAARLDEADPDLRAATARAEAAAARAEAAAQQPRDAGDLSPELRTQLEQIFIEFQQHTTLQQAADEAVQALQQQLRAVEERMASLEQQPQQPTVSPHSLALTVARLQEPAVEERRLLTQRITQLEERSVGAGPDGLERRVAALETALACPPSPPFVSPAAFDALAAKVAAMEAQEAVRDSVGTVKQQCDEHCEDLRRRLASVEGTAAELGKQLAAAQSRRASVDPEAGRRLAEVEALAQRVEREQQGGAAREQELRRQLSELAGQQRSVAGQPRVSPELDSRLRAVESALQPLRAADGALGSRLDALEGRLKGAQEGSAPAARVVELSGEVANLREQVQGLDDLRKRVAALEALAQAAAGERQALREQLAALKGTVAGATSRLDAADTQLQRIEDDVHLIHDDVLGSMGLKSQFQSLQSQHTELSGFVECTASKLDSDRESLVSRMHALELKCSEIDPLRREVERQGAFTGMPSVKGRGDSSAKQPP